MDSGVVTMNLRYLLVDVDGIGSFGAEPFEQIRKLVGPEGPVRVPFVPQAFLAGWVNDCGHLFPDRYPRNVVGSVLLGCVGAAQYPYAGPVVFTGWDGIGPQQGASEVTGLHQVQVDALRILLDDIRKVLGLQPGEPSSLAPRAWAQHVLLLAEHVRTCATPTMTIVHDPGERQAVRGWMGGRP